MTFVYIIFASLLSYSYGAEAEYLLNVDCAPYIDYISTDPGLYRYDPMYVNLYRCHGKYYESNPRNRKCVPKPDSINNINITVFKFDGQSKVIKVENHTECTQVCVISQQNCTKYQTFNPNECNCKCNYTSSSGKAKCVAPFIWDLFKCDCVCPTSPETVTCGKRKEFSTEECGCTCKAKHFIRCAKRKQSINRNTCYCEDPVITVGKQQSGCEGGVNGAMLAVIILVEAFAIVFCYYFFYVYCYKHNYLDQKEDKNMSGYYRNGDIANDTRATNSEYHIDTGYDDYNLNNENPLSDKERIRREEINRDKAKYPLLADKDLIHREEDNQGKSRYPYYPDEEKSPLALKQESDEYYVYSDIMEVDAPPSSTEGNHNLNIPPEYSDVVSELSEDGYASVTQV